MKRKLSTLLLAVTLVTTLTMPKKADAGLMVTGAGLMSSGNVALGVTFFGFAMIIGGALAGNAALVVLGQDQVKAPLYPFVANQFPFLLDQPAVIEDIALKLEKKVKSVDLKTLPTEVKLSDAEVETILDQAIVDDAQAEQIANMLK